MEKIKYINVEFLKQYPRLKTKGVNTNGYLFIVDDNTLYKVFNSYYYSKEHEKIIDYLLNKVMVKDSAYPLYKLYCNNIFIGYAMEYFTNNISFKELTKEYLKYPEKKILIEDTTNQLKQYHNNEIIIGDIHLDNMIGDERGHLIDVDDALIPGLPAIFPQRYHLRDLHGNVVGGCSKNIDNVKSIICYLSLLFNKNLELKIMDYDDIISLNDIKDYVYPKVSKRIRNYLDECFSLEGNPIYFDEVIDEFKNKKLVL